MPLVGCGMLSWAMLNASDTTTRIMITGRVNCNTFGFFNNDSVKETLEVKLKLQEVHTFTQEQFVNSVHVYSAIAKCLPGNFDASTWSNFVKANPVILEESMRSNARARLQTPPSNRRGGFNTTPASFVRQHWKEATLNNTDESDQPPKKRARMALKTAAKISNNSKKKTKTPMVSTRASTLERDSVCALNSSLPTPEVSMLQSRQPVQSAQPNKSDLPSACSLLATVLPDVSPSPQLNNMASSPPQAEDAPLREGISPAPTSPMLPTLPAPLSKLKRLETVVENTENLTVKVEPQSEAARSEVVDEGNGLFLPPLPSAIPTAKLTQENVYLNVASVPAKPKSRRKQTKKAISSQSLPSTISSEDGLQSWDSNGNEKPKRSRTAVHAKERIQKQLMEAVTRGEMPNFCQNCGAIETPVWRKVRVLNNLGDGKENELLLCNPCGLWHSSRKSMRPQEFWDGRKAEPTNSTKSRKKNSLQGAPLEDPAKTPSEQPVGVPGKRSAEPGEETTRALALPEQKRSSTMTPRSYRLVINNNTEWGEAIQASRRVAKSSPVMGSADSPIEVDGIVDGQDSPRRLLFGHSRKANTARLVIKDGVATVSPEDEAADKENDVPGVSATIGPRTPIKNVLPSRQPQTPLRSASRIYQSPWKTLVYASVKCSKSGSPATPERRLVKTDQQRHQLSPTASLLEKLLAETDAPISEYNVLTDIPELSSQLSFEMDEEFWNNGIHTDMSIPSSPPGPLDLFEDHGGSIPDCDGVPNDDSNWGRFLPSSPSAVCVCGGLFEHNGQDCGGKGLTVDLSAFINEASRGGGDTERATSPSP